MLINPFKNAFGLDFGDRSIKIVQLSRSVLGFKDYGFKLQHASSIDLPAGLIVDGEIQKPEEVIKILRNHFSARRDGWRRSPWVVVCLPETKTYIQLARVRTDEEDGAISEETIRTAAPSYLPYELENVYLDWQILDNDNSTALEKDVLLTAVPKTIADAYTYMLNIAGFTPLALEVEATAIARSVINSRKNLSDESRGILDLGATRSSFVIYDHGTVQFSLSLPISGLQITEKIEAGLKVDFVEAEKLKRECGVEPRKCQGKLKAVLADILEDLSTKIFQAVQFYKLHFPGKNTLTGIRLCGGGANLPALESFLSARLKIKVRKANPWVNLFPIDRLPLSPEESLRYTTAIGLAMRALDKPIIF